MTTPTLKLNCTRKIEIEPTSPFCFDATVWKPLHFPSSDQAWKPGVLWQTIRVQDATYGVVLRNKSEVDSPLVELTVFAKNPLTGKGMEDIADEVRWRYNLDSKEISSFVRRFRTDRLLGPVIRKRSGTRMKSGYSLYKYLVITAMLQNTVVRRSVQMLQNLFEAYGRLVEFDGMRLWSFWGPEAINRTSEDELRRLKVGYRARILRRQAAQFESGEIDMAKLRELKGDALLERLDEIYGVGPQSA